MPTVAHVCERFLALKQALRDADQLSESRITTYRSYLGVLVKDHGQREAMELRPPDIQVWILGHQEWQSDHTRLDAARSVAACWRWADDEAGLLERNHLKRIRKCWGTPQPRRAITSDEYATMQRYARQQNGHGTGRRLPGRVALRVALHFLWESGARTCEMRESTWADVDWGQSVIRLAKHKTDRTGNDRLIPLSYGLLRLLGFLYLRRSWLAHGRPPLLTDRLFLCSRGRPWTKDTFARLFRRYADRAGIRPDITGYCLRHGFCVQGLENGVGNQQLAHVLGHSSTRYVEWYGRDLAGKAGYLRAVADQVRGRKK